MAFRDSTEFGRNQGDILTLPLSNLRQHRDEAKGAYSVETPRQTFWAQQRIQLSQSIHPDFSYDVGSDVIHVAALVRSDFFPPPSRSRRNTPIC